MKEHEITYLLENVIETGITIEDITEKPKNTDYLCLVVNKYTDDEYIKEKLLYIPIDNIKTPILLFDLYVGGDDEYYESQAHVELISLSPKLVIKVNDSKKEFNLSFSDNIFLCSDVWDNGMEAVSKMRKKYGNRITVSPIIKSDNYLLEYHNKELEKDNLICDNKLIINNIECIPYQFFSGRMDFDSLILRNIKIVSPYSFSECRNLKKVKILSNVERIAYCSFVGCEIEEVDIVFPTVKLEKNSFLKANSDMSKFSIIIHERNIEIEEYAKENNVKIIFKE